MLTDGLEIIVMFLSALILMAPIHCSNSDAMLHFSKSDEETNSAELFLVKWNVKAISPSFSAMLCLWLTVALFHTASNRRLPQLEHASLT